MSSIRQRPKEKGAPEAASARERSNLRRDVRAVVRRFRKLEADFQQVTAQRDRVIRDAHAAGITPSELSEDTGLSPQRIDQIRRGARL